MPLVLPAADWPQWRGPQRNGISAETGLLAEWPKEGPQLVWQVKDIGSGYSTPSVVGDRLYLLSNQGLDNEFVQALDAKDGKQVWSQRIGKVGNPDQQPNYPAARSTPTVDGEWLFALGSDGDLACLERASGKVRWQKNVRKDYGGQPGTWAYAGVAVGGRRGGGLHAGRSGRNHGGAEQGDGRTDLEVRRPGRRAGGLHLGAGGSRWAGSGNTSRCCRRAWWESRRRRASCCGAMTERPKAARR